MFLNSNSNKFRENNDNNIVIIKSVGANLNNLCKEDIIYLMGKTTSESNIYYENLYILISNGETGKDITFNIENGSGYSPRIYISDFNGDGLDEILFTSEQGGSGGYINVNLYKFKNDNLEEIFNSESINNENIYTVNYRNNYVVEVKDEAENKKYLIDISMRDKEYLNEMYNEKGVLKKSIKGQVLSVGGAYSIDIDNDKFSELFIVQRIIGIYNSDTLGYINSILKFDKENFSVIKKNLSIEGTSQGCSRFCKEIKNGIIKNKCSIDFSKVNFIEAEKIKDHKIERALEKEFNVKAGIDKLTYLYNKIDLNDNKENNVIAYIEGPRFCRCDGCTVVILENKGKEYSVISKIYGSKNPIIISDEKTNGYKNIIMKVDTRAGETIYNELRFNGNSYPLNPECEPRVKKGNKIEGIAIIADDLFYVKGIDF